MRQRADLGRLFDEPASVTESRSPEADDRRALGAWSRARCRARHGPFLLRQACQAYADELIQRAATDVAVFWTIDAAHLARLALDSGEEPVELIAARQRVGEWTQATRTGGVT